MFGTNFYANVPPKRKYAEDGELPEIKRSKNIPPPNFAQSKLESLRNKENLATPCERADLYYKKK